MHRLRYLLKCDRNGLHLHKHLSENGERISIKPTIRSFKTRQALCAEKSGSPDDDTGIEKLAKDDDVKGDGVQKDRNLQAKAKLQNLLKSIVENSKKDATEKMGTSVVDMKLAVPKKERKVPIQDSSQTAEEKETEKDLGKEMVGAVKKVAESFEGDSQVVESELVQKLKTQVGKKINLSDLFVGMKIDRSSKADSSSAGDMELSRAHRVRRLLDERTRESKRLRDAPGAPQMTRQRRIPVSKPSYVPIDLFGAPPLGIFSTKSTTEATLKEDPKTLPPSSRLETWDLLNARDLKLSITHPPANGFEEMILWTEQGKLWKFPIDNEQGLDEEAKVPFHEHVFLEHQIEGWCPKKGPIRHFMELVCVGLSKNPFLTVKEKHEQIEWYHQYFKEKASIIKDVGAGEIK